MQCKKFSQFSVVQCIAVQYNEVQCSEGQYSTVQYSIVHCTAVQCSVLYYSAGQYLEVQCSAVQTLQCSVKQYCSVDVNAELCSRGVWRLI